MKTTILFLSMLTLASSCGSSINKQEKQPEAVESTTTTETPKPETSQEPVAEDRPEHNLQNSMLLGKIEKKDLLSPPFDDWYNRNFDTYTPDHEVMETLKAKIPEVDQIRVFMGTWCPDSRREVPKLFKILELAEYDLEKVEIIAVDRSKTTPDNSHELYNIKRVPTIIFYKDGEELNRVVEYSLETLEKDIAKIVSGEAYEHAYQN